MSLIVVKKPESVKKDYINRSRLSEPKEGVLFTDFIAKIVERKSKRLGKSYVNSYKTLVSHLNNFAYKYQVTLYTNSINEEFLEDFIQYLHELDLKQSYVKNLLQLVKTMANKAGTYGYAVDFSYDDVSIEDDDPFAVYLTMTEIARIYYHTGLTHKQERIRDLFVVGCLTALRYSDYSTLTNDNFQGDYIVKITKKTGKKVVIPIHEIVAEIYNKYDQSIPAGICIQHFNKYIKKICHKIGIDDQVTFNYTRGGKLHTETKPKYELISSHTARRSAATNLYLTGRMKTYEIMSLTGHTTEKSFFRYIKTTTEDKAKQISTDIFFKK